MLLPTDAYGEQAGSFQLIMFRYIFFGEKKLLLNTNTITCIPLPSSTTSDNDIDIVKYNKHESLQVFQKCLKYAIIGHFYTFVQNGINTSNETVYYTGFSKDTSSKKSLNLLFLNKISKISIF